MANYLKIFEDKHAFNVYASKNEQYPLSHIVRDIDLMIQKQSENYFALRIAEDGTFTFTPTNSNTLSYSLDNGETWEELNGTTPTIEGGSKVLFKGTCTPLSSTPYGIGTFSSTSSFNAEGNAMSLLFGDNFTNQTSLNGKNYALANLFSGSSIVSANKLALPATTLSQGCYYSMFEGCSSLTETPQLLAMTMANQCYYGMFKGCTSLTEAPQLPATTLSGYCYYQMFSGCTNLMEAPQLQATELATQCYYSMFSYCTNLTETPILPATTLAQSCYEYMFQNCSSLTEVSELWATELQNRCYRGMFIGCTSLEVAPELPATTLANGCYRDMFSGCTSLTEAPLLPATTLANSAYTSMFRDCSSLSAITSYATDISASNATTNWVNGVAEYGVFKKDSNMTDWSIGNNGIPTNWIIKNLETPLICKYYVPSVEEEEARSLNYIHLYYYYAEEGQEEWWVRAVDLFNKVVIDSQEVTVEELDEEQGYYPLSEGLHTVEFYLKDETTVKSGVFGDIRNIVEANIPEGVTTLEEWSFGSSSIEHVTLPSTITTIENGAFSDCCNLDSQSVSAITAINPDAYSCHSGGGDNPK